jgi:ankyrin repeat protein
MDDIRFLEYVQAGDMSAVERQLALDSSLVNARGKWGWPALHWAVFIASMKLAELLIANGADVNARNDYGETIMFLR